MLTVLILVGLALVVLLRGPLWSLRNDSNADEAFNVVLIVSGAVFVVFVAWFVSQQGIS